MGYKEGNGLVFSINYKFHWFFVTLDQNSLIVYDSLKKSVIEQYLKMEPIQKIINFSFQFYGLALKCKKICDSYPQQDNGFDCGIMTLFGIKDCVRDRSEWSFRCEDAFFKRYQVAKEIR